MNLKTVVANYHVVFHQEKSSTFYIYFGVITQANFPIKEKYCCINNLKSRDWDERLELNRAIKSELPQPSQDFTPYML